MSFRASLSIQKAPSVYSTSWWSVRAALYGSTIGYKDSVQSYSISWPQVVGPILHCLLNIQRYLKYSINTNPFAWPPLHSKNTMDRTIVLQVLNVKVDIENLKIVHLYAWPFWRHKNFIEDSWSIHSLG